MSSYPYKLHPEIGELLPQDIVGEWAKIHKVPDPSARYDAEQRYAWISPVGFACFICGFFVTILIFLIMCGWIARQEGFNIESRSFPSGLELLLGIGLFGFSTIALYMVVRIGYSYVIKYHLDARADLRRIPANNPEVVEDCKKDLHDLVEAIRANWPSKILPNKQSLADFNASYLGAMRMLSIEAREREIFGQDVLATNIKDKIWALYEPGIKFNPKLPTTTELMKEATALVQVSQAALRQMSLIS